MRIVCVPALLASLSMASAAPATPVLLACGMVNAPQQADLSGRTEPLENGDPQNVPGALGSGLAYAGGGTFLAVPDRGPNAAEYNASVDQTTSYIPRFHTIEATLAPSPGGKLPFSIAPRLTATTLLYSTQPLHYGGVPSGAKRQGGAMPAGDAINTRPGVWYFSGRSDNFDANTGSADPLNARLDPEGIRLSPDGKSVFISDEYGPHLYQFDRATGERIRSFKLPDSLYVAHQSAVGKQEEKAATPGNASGRVDNKGMEGLAITPDGKTLVGILQAPTIQDGKSSGLLRIVRVDVSTGATREYAYHLTTGTGVSEIVALNGHQFLVDERDGAGVGGDAPGEGSKDFYVIDLDGAADVTTLDAKAAVAAAVPKRKLVNFAALLRAAGVAVPSKVEGLAFGDDVNVNGTPTHALYVANDNDFVPDRAGPSQFFVVGITDADLAAAGATFTPTPTP